MDKNEIKNIWLSSHLAFDPFNKALMERFFDENDGITYENVNEMYHKWLNSDAGQLACNEIDKKMSDEEDVLIQRSLTSIDRGNYHVLTNTHRGGTFVVSDNETHLHGLITENGDEIFPCIFKRVRVSLDGFIEVSFKQLKFSFNFNPGSFANDLKSSWEKYGEVPKGYFLYRETETYSITHESEFDYHGNDDNPIVKKLFELLNVKHKLDFSE